MSEIWQPPFSDGTREVVVPTYNEGATLAELEAFMDGSCFSSTVPYDGLKAHILEKKRGDRSKETYQVNVVRTGKGMSETPLGNLWWLTVARLYELCSATVHVNSFYTAKPPERSRDIEEITERLRLEKAFIHRAEDFGWHAEIFTHLSEFITANRTDFIVLLTEARDHPTSERPILKDAGLRGSMEGIQSVIEGNTENARIQLFRLVEELHVFMNEYNDDNAHLLLNHERFTPALLRVLYGDKIRKQLVHIALPDSLNEFRGGNGTVGQLFDRAVRRPSNDGEERSQKFARGIVDMLKASANDGGRMENHTTSYLITFDPRLSEWAFSEISPATMKAIIDVDGFAPNANTIVSLLNQCVGGSGGTAKALLLPIKALITKIRTTPVLIAETYAAFLEANLIGQNTHVYYYYIVNALLDTLVEIDEFQGSEKNAFDGAVATARQLISENLEALTLSISDLQTTFSIDIDIQAVVQKLTRFMRTPITLPQKAEHYPFILEAIQAVESNEFSYNALYDLRHTLDDVKYNENTRLQDIIGPELRILQNTMLGKKAQVLKNWEDAYREILCDIFGEEWVDFFDTPDDDADEDLQELSQWD